MKHLLLSFLLLLPLSAHAQKFLSGRIMDDDGPVAKANVTEIDKNFRIINQTTTDDEGYYTMPRRSGRNIIKVSTPHHRIFVEEIDNRKSINMLLIRSTPIEGSELLLKNCPNTDSYKLLFGHNGARYVPQHIYVEMLCDTLFALVVPIRVNNMAEAYPAENTIHFVDAADRHIMSGVNPLASSPIEGHLDNMDFSTEMRSQFIIKRQDASDEYDNGELYYSYPEFIFSTRRLDHLLANEHLVSRVLIETARKDNFWVLYTYPGFGKEITRILERLKKKL
ncbi:MAG: carboxypeptidase regulatory-like domain-containing protein [Bacteroidales bacterium]|nr:carboxypeptidase regulatory-like domain-containing protein [Candidatus Physcousia equi]